MIEGQTISKFNGQDERGIGAEELDSKTQSGISVRRNKECVGFAIRPGFLRRAT